MRPGKPKPQEPDPQHTTIYFPRRRYGWITLPVFPMSEHLNAQSREVNANDEAP